MLISTQIIKCIHVLCGVVFFGLTIASFFYISFSKSLQNKQLLQYAIRTSFFGDGLMAILIPVQFYTATYLLPFSNATLQTPWIKVAYAAFGTVAILWLINLIQKIISYKKQTLIFARLYYTINILMIVILIIIVHDAVMHRTWFA